LQVGSGSSVTRRPPADQDVTITFQAKSEEEDIDDFLAGFM